MKEHCYNVRKLLATVAHRKTRQGFVVHFFAYMHFGETDGRQKRVRHHKI